MLVVRGHGHWFTDKVESPDQGRHSESLAASVTRVTTNASWFTSSHPPSGCPGLAVVCRHNEVALAGEVGRSPVHPHPAGRGSRCTHGDDRDRKSTRLNSSHA